jgi:hypothetical protein
MRQLLSCKRPKAALHVECARIEILGSGTVCFPLSLPSSMSTEANVENEKSPPSPNARFSWLKPKHAEKRDSASFISTADPASVDVRIATPVEDGPKPVSFFGLFRSVPIPVLFIHFFNTVSLRFSTRSELILNVLAIFAAIAAGASQVCASIFFLSRHSQLTYAFGSLS